MSKFFISVICSLVGANVFAADVNITSFRFLEEAKNFSPTAELCGQMAAPSGLPVMIKVTSDPDSKSPGSYHIWTGKDGKFCTILATYTGQANAELE